MVPSGSPGATTHWRADRQPNVGTSVSRRASWSSPSSSLSVSFQEFPGAAASRVPLDGAKLAYTLWIPTLVYTGWFGLLLFTSWRASDVLPRLSERGVLVDLVILRFLGPYARNVIPRLIQPCYAKVHHEDLPVLFGVLSVLGNVAGSLVATGLIGIHQFDYIPGA